MCQHCYGSALPVQPGQNSLYTIWSAQLWVNTARLSVSGYLTDGCLMVACTYNRFYNKTKAEGGYDQGKTGI